MQRKGNHSLAVKLRLINIESEEEEICLENYRPRPSILVRSEVMGLLERFSNRKTCTASLENWFVMSMAKLSSRSLSLARSLASIFFQMITHARLPLPLSRFLVVVGYQDRDTMRCIRLIHSAEQMKLAEPIRTKKKGAFEKKMNSWFSVSFFLSFIYAREVGRDAEQIYSELFLHLLSVHIRSESLISSRTIWIECFCHRFDVSEETEEGEEVCGVSSFQNLIVDQSNEKTERNQRENFKKSPSGGFIHAVISEVKPWFFFRELTDFAQKQIHHGDEFGSSIERRK